MRKKQHKRKEISKKILNFLHIAVIVLKYAFKILKEIKSIIDLFKD